MAWRDTQLPARFCGVDARAAIGLLAFLFHMRLSTLVFAVCLAAFFWVLERRGLTAGAAFRAIRSFPIGRFRPARSRHRRNWRTDR